MQMFCDVKTIGIKSMFAYNAIMTCLEWSPTYHIISRLFSYHWMSLWAPNPYPTFDSFMTCYVVTMGNNNNIPSSSSKDHFHHLKMWQNFRVIPKEWRNVTSGVTAWPLIVVATAPAPLNELTLSQLISAHAHLAELKPVIWSGPHTSLSKYW